MQFPSCCETNLQASIENQNGEKEKEGAPITAIVVVLPSAQVSLARVISYLHFFIFCPVPAPPVHPYSPSTVYQSRSHLLTALCQLHPPTSHENLWLHLETGRPSPRPPLVFSAPLLSARPACMRCARFLFLLVLLCVVPVGGQLTGALIEYVLKHSARHYFTVIAGTRRLMQVLIIRRTRK